MYHSIIKQIIWVSYVGFCSQKASAASYCFTAMRVIPLLREAHSTPEIKGPQEKYLGSKFRSEGGTKGVKNQQSIASSWEMSW